MQIILNKKNNECYIHNLAFVKAILIKETIEKLNVSDYEKENIRNKILQYLKKGCEQN